MTISIDEVNRIAKLARLSFNDDQKQKLQQELSAILDYVGQLDQVKDKAAVQIADDPASINLMRTDVVEEVESPEEFLKQAPGREGNYIKVKSILD